MVCKHCGAEITVGSRFCLNCCCPISYDKETIEKHSLEIEKKNKEIQRNKILRKVRKIVCFFIVFGVVGYGAYAVFYDRNSDEITLNNVSSFVENIREKNNVSNSSDMEIEKPIIELGDSMSVDSYGIYLKELRIVDKNSDKAIFYSMTEGKEYVIISLELINRSKEDIPVSCLLNLKAYLNNELIAPSLSGVLAESLPSIDGLVLKGSTKSGVVCYQLNEDWRNLKIELDIDMKDSENEPVLLIENPKNRSISEDELDEIKEKYDLDAGIDDSILDKLIVDFMHTNALSKNDFISKKDLEKFIENNN